MQTTPQTHSKAENLYANALLYDRIASALGTDDEEPGFYASLLAPQPAGSPGAQALELGCGTGRLTLALAARGLQMTGIDNATAMLDLARRKALAQPFAMQWMLQDLRHFKLAQSFSLILLPNNTLAHLHNVADLQACLHCVLDHLDEDGLLAIDYFNPSVAKLALGPGLVFPLLGPGNAIDPTLTATETSDYDAATQTSAVCWHVHTGPGAGAELRFRMRIWYPLELDGVLTLSGLRIVAKYGGYQRQPFDSQSGKQLLVCARARR